MGRTSQRECIHLRQIHLEHRFHQQMKNNEY